MSTAESMTTPTYSVDGSHPHFKAITLLQGQADKLERSSKAEQESAAYNSREASVCLSRAADCVRERDVILQGIAVLLRGGA